MDIQDWHIHYLAWCFPISGPPGRSLAAAKALAVAGVSVA